MIKVKLRRVNEYSDGWGMFAEEVGADGKDVFYRKSKGGNCVIGEWEEWQNESFVFDFLLGNLSRHINDDTKDGIVDGIIFMPDLSPISNNYQETDTNMEGY